MYSEPAICMLLNSEDVVSISLNPSLQRSRYRRRARQYGSSTWDPSKTFDQDVSDLDGVLKTSLSFWWVDDFEVENDDDDDNNDDNN
jgi:hypothetical protein